jgi:multicomponent Na+:H+ antiporter subunit D
MEINSIQPAIALLIAGLCGFLIFLKGKEAKYRNFFSVFFSLSAFITVLTMLPGALKGNIYVYKLLFLSPGLDLTLRVDSLGLVFGLVSSLLWFIVGIYTIGYMEHKHKKQRFFTFFSLSIFSAFGIAFAANLFTLFLFYELLTVCTYPLVTHEGTPEAFKAGSKYLIYTFTGGGFVLLSVAITYFLTGTLNFSDAPLLSIKHGTTILYLLFASYTIGFGVKAAIMPIHSWLPSAMVAPTPVSTLLHAVAVVKAGVFGVLRMVYFVFGVDLMKQLGLNNVLAGIAAFTIIAASLIAMNQDNLKRRLAYSTISQLSYIVLGAALVSSQAALGAIIHIANHAFTKGTLFMCAGAIAEETGKKNISEMKGLAKRMPLTMAAFTIASLGMLGVPPVAGFVTKWFLGSGAVEARQPVIIAVLILSSLLNALYFLPIAYTAYFDKPEEKEETVKEKKKETTWLMLGPILATATISVLLGIFAGVKGLPLSIAKLGIVTIFKR